MTPFDRFYQSLHEAGLAPHGVHLGPYRGTVVKVVEGDSQGRVVVRCPRISDDDLPPVRPLCLFAGSGWTSSFAPKAGDSVLLMFEDGLPSAGWCIGGWPAADELPAEFRAGASGPTIRGFILRDGVRLLFDETGGKVRIETPSGASAVIGNKRIELTDGQGASAVMADGKTVFTGPVELNGSGNRAVDGDALRRWMMTELKIPSPVGPIGPILDVPETWLSSTVKLD